MKREFFLSSKKQKDVSGTANVLVDGRGPFNGVVDTFVKDGNKVYVVAKQKFDLKRSAALSFSFEADIANGKHEYTEDSGLDISYIEGEVFDGWTRYIFYSGIYNTGNVTLTFDGVAGTLKAGFDLDVETDPGKPLNAIGAFRDVAGLKHINK